MKIGALLLLGTPLVSPTNGTTRKKYCVLGSKSFTVHEQLLRKSFVEPSGHSCHFQCFAFLYSITYSTSSGVLDGVHCKTTFVFCTDKSSGVPGFLAMTFFCGGFADWLEVSKYTIKRNCEFLTHFQKWLNFNENKPSGSFTRRSSFELSKGLNEPVGVSSINKTRNCYPFAT